VSDLLVLFVSTWWHSCLSTWSYHQACQRSDSIHYWDGLSRLIWDIKCLA